MIIQKIYRAQQLTTGLQASKRWVCISGQEEIII